MPLLTCTAASTRPLPRFKADLGRLADIRDFVRESAETLGVSSDILDDLRLAVDEAVTNIVLHGYDGAGDVDIDIAVRENDLVIRLRDGAPPFDPISATPDSLAPAEERTSPGGFGLYLIRQTMDEIGYRRLDSGNELTLVKRDAVNVEKTAQE